MSTSHVIRDVWQTSGLRGFYEMTIPPGVTDPAQIGPALDRAFASGVPYLVNVMTDVAAEYPRTTHGV